MYEKESGTGAVLGAFILGGLVGAALAMLMAPEPGIDTRRRVAGWAGDAGERMGEWTRTAGDRVRETAEQARERMKRS